VSDYVRKVLSDQFWKNKKKIDKAIDDNADDYFFYVDVNCQIKDALAKLGTNVFPEPDVQASQPVSSTVRSDADSTQDPVSS
jgi:hypothetical protein